MSQSADDAVPMEVSAESPSVRMILLQALSLPARATRWPGHSSWEGQAGRSIAMMTGTVTQFNSRPSGVFAPTHRRSAVRLARNSE